MATSNLRFRIIGDDDASGAFLKVAAAARLTKSTFDDLGSSALGLTKLVGGAGLIPVLAGAAAATLELGTAMGAAAGASGIFGLSVVGIVSDMAKQREAIKVTTTALSKLTPGTAEYTAKLKELHAQQQTFNQSFGPAAKGYNDMSNAFSKFKAKTSGVTTSVLGKGMELLAHILPKLVPVSNAAGRAIGGLLDELRGWTKGPGFAALLKWFKTSGPAAITHFGHAIGSILSGLGGIFKNFVGPGDKAAASLENLTKKFAAWGQSKGVSDSVNKFLTYVSDNGPQISSVFSSLAEALPKLASAAGSLGSVNLQAISMFLNLVAQLPQGAFDIIVKGLFGMLVAAKLVGIVKSLQAAFVLLDAAMTANPVGLIVVGIGLLITALVVAYKKVGWFRDGVNAAFGFVGKAAGAVFGWIKDHWALLFAILGGPIGLATVLIIKNFGKVMDAIHLVGRVATWLWNNAFQPALQFIVRGIGFLVSIWAKMLLALGHVPGFGWATDAGNALQAAADKANNLANNIRKIPTHKTSTIVLNTVHNVVHTTGGHVPAFASGTDSAPGGMALVGEQGPELVDLPAGSRVSTAARTRALLGRSGGDLGTITIDVTLDGRVIQQKLLRLKRVNGGLELGLS